MDFLALPLKSIEAKTHNSAPNRLIVLFHEMSRWEWASLNRMGILMLSLELLQIAQVGMVLEFWEPVEDISAVDPEHRGL